MENLILVNILNLVIYISSQHGCYQTWCSQSSSIKSLVTKGKLFIAFPQTYFLFESNIGTFTIIFSCNCLTKSCVLSSLYTFCVINVLVPGREIRKSKEIVLQKYFLLWIPFKIFWQL